MVDEYDEVPFEIGIETTRWTFDNGDYLTIEKNTSGYFLSGRVGGKDIHDDDHEDFYFPDTDSLLGFLEQHGLLSVLTKKGDAP